jgi:hypothetical protein
VAISRLMNALIDLNFSYHNELTFATITNEIREASPRLRLVGAFPPRKHTIMGSLGNIICRDFSEPARADSDRCRHAGRNSHDAITVHTGSDFGSAGFLTGF